MINEKQKAIFVALARLEEEQSRFMAVQAFYEERIQTAQRHAVGSSPQHQATENGHLHH